MPLRLSTSLVLLYLGLLGIWGCKPSDPVVPGTPATGSPEADIYACKFYRFDQKTVSVDEIGRSLGTSSGFSLSSYLDTVYTNLGSVFTYKHTFDGQQFLTKRFSSVRSLQTGSNAINDRLETTFQYTDGKLTSALTSNTISSGLVYTSSTRYTYDTDGKVNKYVFTGADGSTNTQTFEGGILRSYRLVNGQGEVDDRTPYINNQGLFTQVDLTKGSHFNRFAYDPAGNLVRLEEWRLGELASYTTYEYGARSNQGSATFTHKGHPVLPDPSGSGANFITKSTSYGIVGGYTQLTKRSESDYTYTMNERGLMSKRIRTTRWFTMDGTVYQTDTSEDQFGYLPCK